VQRRVIRRDVPRHGPLCDTLALPAQSAGTKCALCALLLIRPLILGPLGPGGGTEESPQGGWHGCQPVFRQYMDVLSKNPVIPPRTLWAKPTKRVLGVALLFGYFLLGKQEKVTRPSADGRNARRVGEQPGHNTPTAKSLDSSFRWSDGLRRPEARVTTHPNLLPEGERKPTRSKINAIRQARHATAPPRAPTAQPHSNPHD
jgi:hypothetical protein